MAVPKPKVSKSRRDKRRAHDALRAPALATCSRCNQAKRPHRVCANCGHYADVKKVEVEGA
jgi:large subunit ribosomal protein L32